jgi:hypothetical protein
MPRCELYKSKWKIWGLVCLDVSSSKNRSDVSFWLWVWGNRIFCYCTYWHNHAKMAHLIPINVGPRGIVFSLYINGEDVMLEHVNDFIHMSICLPQPWVLWSVATEEVFKTTTQLNNCLHCTKQKWRNVTEEAKNVLFGESVVVYEASSFP